MRKRLTAFALALIMIFGLFSFAGCKGRNDNIDHAEKYITRGQWIIMLTEAFELDSYRENSPYYANIGSGHELFTHVQAASEWDILSIYQDSTLDVDKPVTRSEVASTAAFAAGFKPEADSFDENSQFVSQPSIDYAITHGLIDDKDLSGFMTGQECETVLELSKSLYLNGDGEEEISVIYNENLVDLTKIDPNFIEVAENSVTFLSNISGEVGQDSTGTLTAPIQTGDGMIQIHVGDTFVTPPMEGRQAETAYKVVSMEETSRGITFTTETPTLGDLYDELVVHTTLFLDESCITWADGVTVSPAAPNNLSQSAQTDTYHIEFLSSRLEEEPIKADYLSDRTFRGELGPIPFFLGDGAIKLLSGDTSDQNKLNDALQALAQSGFDYPNTPSISDFNDSTEPWTKKLEKEDKFVEGHFKIEGDITVALEVTPDIEYHKWDFFGLESSLPKSASLAVKSNIVTNLNIEGDVSKEFELATFLIPTSIPGLAIEGTISIVAELNGSIQVKTECQNTNRVEWQSPLNFRQASERIPSKPDVEALVDFTIGRGISVSASAFSVDIIGLELDLALGGNVTGTLEGECSEYIENDTIMRDYRASIHVQMGLYFPIISLTASGPDFLVDTFGLEKTWDIVDKDQAYSLWSWEEEFPFWAQTVELDPDGNVIDPSLKLLFDIQHGDFSAFSGTYSTSAEYVQYYGISDYPDITLSEDGIITGGITFSWGDTQEYAGTPPTSVVRGDDGGWGKGTFQCFVAEDTQGYQSEYYIIYPPGTLDSTNATYISYIFAGGGIMDIRYTKID